MKEKYELLKEKLIELKNNQKKCHHEWNEPVLDPDIFDGINRWTYTCKLCAKKITTLEKFDISNDNEAIKRHK